MSNDCGEFTIARPPFEFRQNVELAPPSNADVPKRNALMDWRDLSEGALCAGLTNRASDSILLRERVFLFQNLRRADVCIAGVGEVVMRAFVPTFASPLSSEGV